MNWLEDMNRALDYIENNLQQKVDYNKIAEVACCSVYHFQRMFTFMTDLTLSEYIRRRKMTMAAFELQNSNIKVIDLALKYGYESPEAFTRAFQNLHGITPTAARSKGANIKAFPRISFQISVKGVSEMNYKIEKKDAFTVFGFEKEISLVDGKNFTEVPLFWKEFYESGMYDQLYKDPEGDYNAVMCYEPYTGETMMYMICSLKKDGVDTTGFKEVCIPEAEWVVFSTDKVKYGTGAITAAIQDIWKRIFTEWFPMSNYEHAPLPECEFYYPSENDTEYAEVWIPIMKK